MICKQIPAHHAICDEKCRIRYSNECFQSFVGFANLLFKNWDTKGSSRAWRSDHRPSPQGWPTQLSLRPSFVWPANPSAPAQSAGLAQTGRSVGVVLGRSSSVLRTKLSLDHSSLPRTSLFLEGEVLSEGWAWPFAPSGLTAQPSSRVVSRGALAVRPYGPHWLPSPHHSRFATSRPRRGRSTESTEG